MTKEELLNRLNDIEWNDFEVKEASGGLPGSMWETVSAFSNTEGGWIVLGVKEKRKESGSEYMITGVAEPEKIDEIITTTLRSRTKFNTLISARVLKYEIDGKTVLAYEIPLSPHRPVAIKSSGEVFIRTGSGDSLASDLEVDAIARDASYGTKSEMEVSGTNFSDVNLESIASYRSYLRDFNRPLSYPTLDVEEFCNKLNIVLPSGKMSYGSLLMFGKRDSILKALPNFWIDYMEIPGPSYAKALQRYTYRMPEQENIWESFQLIMSRLRNFVDAPYIEGPDIFGTEDNSQLFCLREGLVNFCAHSDYFAAAHPTIRVFSDKIVMQNPGRFILAADEFRNRILSMPRNPSIIKFFRHPKLSENAGYGIDKILRWKELTGNAVIFDSNTLISTVTYPLKAEEGQDTTQKTTPKTTQKTTQKLSTLQSQIIDYLRDNPTAGRLEIAAKIKDITEDGVKYNLKVLQEKGVLVRIGPAKGGHWEIIEASE